MYLSDVGRNVGDQGDETEEEDNRQPDAEATIHGAWPTDQLVPPR
jgi:hypothetical protein